MGVDYLVVFLVFLVLSGGACPLKTTSEYTEKMHFYHALFAFCVELIDLLSKPVRPS